MAEQGTVVTKGMILAVLAARIHTGRQSFEQGAVQAATDVFPTQLFGPRGDDDRLKTRSQKAFHHLLRRVAPERFLDRHAARSQLLLPAAAYVVQKDVAKNEPGDPLGPEMIGRLPHGGVVSGHLSRRSQIDHMERQADAIGLGAQERFRNGVHG